MNRWLLLLLIWVLQACKGEKIDLTGNEKVKEDDFVALFKEITLPVTYTDTGLSRIGDTISFGTKLLSQFIPDSVLSKELPLKGKFSVHPIGKINRKDDKELYLFFKTQTVNNTTAWVVVMNKKSKFLTAQQLIQAVNKNGYSYAVSINREPTFTISRERINPSTKILGFTREAYTYNAATQKFLLILNDSNEDAAALEILNPIDSLPALQPLSGDYKNDDKNYVSVRDGKDANTYLFFVHFEKKQGTCVGELKGEIKLTAENKAIYEQSGDPCVIDFTFSKNNLKIKEKGSCGNRRGMNCYFDDNYEKVKKKVVKLAANK